MLNQAFNLVYKFLSTPSGWRATAYFSEMTKMYKFLSTPSGWRATVFLKVDIHRVVISIHALRVEGDHFHFARGFVTTNFYPRPPGGGRPRISCAETVSF